MRQVEIGQRSLTPTNQSTDPCISYIGLGQLERLEVGQWVKGGLMAEILGTTLLFHPIENSDKMMIVQPFYPTRF